MIGAVVLLNVCTADGDILASVNNVHKMRMSQLQNQTL